jgi:DNA helicase II / ATP-dependent DNA helicase PcrA
MKSSVVANVPTEPTSDDIIAACLNLDQPRSFFLLAGAGSGKTRALVTAVSRLRADSGVHLRLRG